MLQSQAAIIREVAGAVRDTGADSGIQGDIERFLSLTGQPA